MTAGLERDASHLEEHASGRSLTLDLEKAVCHGRGKCLHMIHESCGPSSGGVWSSAHVIPPHPGEGAGGVRSKRKRMHRVGKIERGKRPCNHEERLSFVRALADGSIRGQLGREG